jgi:hypothetical protein
MLSGDFVFAGDVGRPDLLEAHLEPKGLDNACERTKSPARGTISGV